MQVWLLLQASSMRVLHNAHAVSSLESCPLWNASREVASSACHVQVALYETSLHFVPLLLVYAAGAVMPVQAVHWQC